MIARTCTSDCSYMNKQLLIHEQAKMWTIKSGGTCHATNIPQSNDDNKKSLNVLSFIINHVILQRKTQALYHAKWSMN